MIGAQYKVLVLTDHSAHSESNSLYAIMQRMRMHKKCTHIDVASRGVLYNRPFFNDHDPSFLLAHRVTEDFQFIAKASMLEQDLKPAQLHEYDLVMLRLPRPISDDFLLWLEELFEGTPIVNKPSGIIKTSNKAFLLNFPELCPPIRLVHSVDDVLNFSKAFPIVLKPLREYGGKGIIKISDGVVDDGRRFHNTADYLSTIEKVLKAEGYLAMQYLKNVNQGDKRIIVVGGTIMASSLRLPAPDSWLCNVSQGGQSVPSDVTEEEKNIIHQIAPVLKEEGVLIYGVDTLVDDDGKRILSEINTLSVGGFIDAQTYTGLPIIQMTVDKIFNYAANA